MQKHVTRSREPGQTPMPGHLLQTLTEQRACDFVQRKERKHQHQSGGGGKGTLFLNFLINEVMTVKTQSV